MSEQKTVAFHTLGCKVNQYDTQAMRERFEQAGYRTTEFDEQADIYVVNTCTVTGTGDKKSMQIIRRCHRQNPLAQIVVTGCLAQRAADELTLPGVRLVLGTQRRGEVVQLLEQAMDMLFADDAPCDGSLLTNARQAEAIVRARDSLRLAQRSMQAGLTPDAVLVDVEAAMLALGEVTGRTMREDITNRIFERFCVGK